MKYQSEINQIITFFGFGKMNFLPENLAVIKSRISESQGTTVWKNFRKKGLPPISGMFAKILPSQARSRLHRNLGAETGPAKSPWPDISSFARAAARNRSSISEKGTQEGFKPFRNEIEYKLKEKGNGRNEMNSGIEDSQGYAVVRTDKRFYAAEMSKCIFRNMTTKLGNRRTKRKKGENRKIGNYPMQPTSRTLPSRSVFIGRDVDKTFRATTLEVSRLFWIAFSNWIAVVEWVVLTGIWSWNNKDFFLLGSSQLKHIFCRVSG